MQSTPCSADSSIGQILTFLQRNGEATIRQLETELSVSTTAVREHSINLRNGRGRPRIVYSLTEQARDAFPRSYDTLVTVLLDEIARQQGEDGLTQLLDTVSERLADGFQRSGNGDLESRMGNVQKMMESRGIPVEVQPDSHGFTFYACPYHEVALEHPAICAMEKHMLEQMLGHAIRSDTSIRKGSRVCSFSVATGANTIALVE
ncbi:MAG: TrmB family transcriptional regulator [Chloroflexales bacterium]|nr:TrmB family transcriptional regulator [Chloroflexales bacterium]